MKVTISGSSSAAGKGCATVFLSVFAIAGLVFFGLFCRAGWDTVRAYSWTKTDCTIESSEMRESGDEAEYTVRYTYRFEGRNYTGTRYSVGMAGVMDSASVQRALQRYPQGAAAICYVNASLPAESALRRGDLWPLVFGVIPLIFVAFGVGGIIGVWRARPASAAAVSERVRGGKGGVLGMRIFGLVFILVGGGTMYAILFRPILKEMSAAKWPQVPCEILSSKVGRHSGSKGGSTYAMEVRYRYTVGGRELIGTRYSFDSGTSSALDWRNAAVASLPPGKMTVCYVNPDDPLEAVLNVKGSPDRWFGLIPAVFLAVGLFIFFKAPAAGRPAAVVPRTVAGSGTGMSPIREESGDGETVLKPATPRGCAFAGILFVALVWNGITWGFLLSTRVGEWGPRIFLSVFALVGLGLLAAAFHQFLALFNPRPVLTVGRPAVPLGGTLDLRWQFEGNVRRIVSASISLVAREEATYRRGTDTRTDRNIFVNTVLLESTDPAEFSSGSISVEIPSNSIHTFTAPHNKIVWFLRVQGDIPKWPDVNAEFPITILPREDAPQVRKQRSDT